MANVGGTLMLYHVSPGSNLDGILRVGVDPSKSRGAREVSWWVARERVEWALVHVSARYSVSTGGLWVFEARVPEYVPRRTKMLFVYTTALVIRPQAHFNASHYLTQTF